MDATVLLRQTQCQGSTPWRRLILQLHRLYGHPVGLLNHRQRRVDAVDDGGGTVDIRVCVTGDCHVLDQLNDCKDLYRQEACHPEDPRLLGFEAQRVLFAACQTAETAGKTLITLPTWKTTSCSPMRIFS